MAAGHLELGRAGEDAAWKLLQSKGYCLLARNWARNRFELDLVCEDGDTVVFVEVKTRAAGSRALPGQALTRDKMKKTVKAAAYYLSSEQFWDRPCRFDLVAVSAGDGSDRDGLVVEHVENAFDLSQVPGAGHFWQP